MLFLLASPATWACYDPAGSGQCGPYGIGPRNPEGYGNNTYAEPAPVYLPPSPPPTHHCPPARKAAKSAPTPAPDASAAHTAPTAPEILTAPWLKATPTAPPA